MCDTLCVRTRDGMLFAKNSDRHPDETQVVEGHDRRTATTELHTQYLTIDDHDACAFVGSRPTWLWGVEHGVNEHGVAIGNEKIWTVDNPRDREPALIGMDLVRIALERSQSADEAQTIITGLVHKHGQGGSGEPHRSEPYDSSFLVADRADAFVIETCNRTWAVRAVDRGAALSNRITLSTDWKRASADVAPGTDFDDFRWKRMPTSIADGRLAVTMGVVAPRSSATAEDLARTLRSHDDDGSGFTVCMHRRDLHSQTTASMIAELRTDGRVRTWTCLGNPCCGVYVPGFGRAVAPELADPEQWQRFALLRNRIEADPDRTAEVQAALANIESNLWIEGDAAFSAGDPGQLIEFALRAYAPVDAALHRLGV